MCNSKIQTFFIDKSKLVTDSLFNLSSIFIVGVSGIIINMVIARFYTSYDLGVFNQVYAVYVLFSQLATIGVQVSVLKHVAQHADTVKKNEIISAAIYLALFFATFFTSILFFIKDFLGKVLNSPGVASALIYVLVGLWCFALNKVFMGILNGLERMKAYAFFTALRGLGFIVCILTAAFLRIEGHKLPLIFTFTEAMVMLSLLLFTKRFFSFVPLKACISWIRTHLAFGLKSLSNGLVTQLYIRVDVLILGFFSTDRIVGIYSMAAIIIEGIFQIPFVLRRIFDPKLTKGIYQNQKEDVWVLIRSGSFRVFMVMFPVFAVVVFCYPLVINLITGNPDFKASWKVLLILSAGGVIQSSYIPFSGLMMLGGYPGHQSLFILSVCIINIALNFLLIPAYGMYGAAAATAISFVCFVIIFKLYTYRLFKLRV